MNPPQPSVRPDQPPIIAKHGVLPALTLTATGRRVAEALVQA